MAGGRPTEYTEELLEKARAYLDSCEDEEVEEEKKEGWTTYRTKVKIPTKGGLARCLGVARDTLYDWAKKYEEFSYIMEELGAEQEERLINGGLSGEYNSTITKVLLTKHGYREGLDQTTNEKELPVPLLYALHNNDSNTEAK